MADRNNRQIIFKIPNLPGPAEQKADYGVTLASAVSLAAESGNLVKYYTKLYGVGIGAAIGLEGNINSLQEQRGNRSDYNISFNVEDQDEPHARSLLLGTPVMFPLEFQGGTYTDLQGVSKNFPNIVFETVVCTVNMTKNIQKTVVQGRNGTVKELISNGDYMVQVRAIIPSMHYGKFPYNDVNDLYRVIESPVSIPIISKYLVLFGINWLTIETFSTEQIPGEYSHVRLVLECCSDKPLIIKTRG